MKKFAALMLAATLALAGCAGSTSDPSPQAKEPAASAPTSAAPSATTTSGTVVGIVIKDGKATPQGKRVEAKVGAKITLSIRSDADEEIHVHSDPEHTFQVEPGKAISETFTVETPGQVAVEAHHLGVTIVQLVVRP